jgi:hypothetical protein
VSVTKHSRRRLRSHGEKEIGRAADTTTTAPPPPRDARSGARQDLAAVRRAACSSVAGGLVRIVPIFPQRKNPNHPISSFPRIVPCQFGFRSFFKNLHLVDRYICLIWVRFLVCYDEIHRLLRLGDFHLSNRFLVYFLWGFLSSFELLLGRHGDLLSSIELFIGRLGDLDHD